MVSKGDAELLNLDGRKSEHFPQGENGVYAGYYPSNCAAAVAHLEQLRDCGMEFLLFPATAFWWLEHYKAFHHHLEINYQRLHKDDTCLVYQIMTRTAPAAEPTDNAIA